MAAPGGGWSPRAIGRGDVREGSSITALLNQLTNQHKQTIIMITGYDNDE
jgi:hypothetical protein